MGQLLYSTIHEVSFDDRVLAHLQLVIMGKLRRNEAFHFSWTNKIEHGSGRTSLWMHPTIPLVFKFHGSRMPAINREWLEELMISANSPGGLRITAEPRQQDTGEPEPSPTPAPTGSGR